MKKNIYRVKKGSFNFTKDLVCHIEVRAFYSLYIQLRARCNIKEKEYLTNGQRYFTLKTQ